MWIVLWEKFSGYKSEFIASKLYYASYVIYTCIFGQSLFIFFTHFELLDIEIIKCIE